MGGGKGKTRGFCSRVPSELGRGARIRGGGSKNRHRC